MKTKVKYKVALSPAGWRIRANLCVSVNPQAPKAARPRSAPSTFLNKRTGNVYENKW